MSSDFTLQITFDGGHLISGWGPCLFFRLEQQTLSIAVNAPAEEDFYFDIDKGHEQTLCGGWTVGF